MNRRVGYALVFVGFFLVFFALLVRFYAYPRLQKIPLSHYSQSVAAGSGTYFNRGQLKEVTARLQNIRTAKGDPRAGSSRTAVWDTFSMTKDLSDNGVLTAEQERIALDRVTGQPRRCCGEKPAHTGLTLKFPFNTQKHTYLFWDPTARRAFPANYVEEERVESLKVYRFEQRFSDIPLQRVEISGAQAGRPSLATVPATVIYDSDTTLWVEPHSGIIVKAGQNVNETLQTNDGRPVLTVVQADLALDDNTVRRNVEEARSAARQLRTVQWLLPIAALALGVMLSVVGIVLTLRQVPGRERHKQQVLESRPVDTR